MKFTKIIAVNFIAAVFIFLFTYTALSKLGSLASFRLVLDQIVVVRHYSSFLSVGIPAAELMIAVLLLFPVTRKTGLYSSLALMFIFSIYIGVMLLFQSNLPCSCGGVIQSLSWKQHLALNVFLTLLAATGTRLEIYQTSYCNSRRSRKPVETSRQISHA